MNVGRNAPCPCGSGKKYKKCCLSKDEVQRDQLTPRLLTRCSEEAAKVLVTHAARLRGKDFLNEAWREFGVDHVGLFVHEGPYTVLFIPWALYVWEADGGASGATREGTVAADFLRSGSARRVGEQTRRYIEACSTEPLTFWQVEAVEPGEGMSLRDMATGRECFVHERLASETLVPWDVMFGQVIAVDGVHCLSISGPYILPAASFRLQVEQFLAEEIEAARLLDHSQDLIDFYIACVDRLLNPQLPEIRNTEGDKLEWAESTYGFDPEVRGRLLGRLDQMRNIEAVPADEGAEGGEEFIWVSQQKDGILERTNRAHIDVHAETLVTECNSRKRDRLLRERLLKSLGDLLTHEETSHKTLDGDALAATGDAGPAPSGALDLNELPPEAQDQLREMMDGIHMRWSDEAVPVLGGQTPREAVKTTSGRQQVASLLNDFENQQRRTPNPQHTFDYNKVRRDLGLDEE